MYRGAISSRKPRLGFLKPLVFVAVILGTAVSAFSPYLSSADAHSGETGPPAASAPAATPAATPAEAQSSVEDSDSAPTRSVEASPDASTNTGAGKPAGRGVARPADVIEIVPSDQAPTDVLEAPRTRTSSDAPRVNGPSTVGDPTWTSTELADADKPKEPALSPSSTTTSDDEPAHAATDTHPPTSAATAETPVPELAFTGIEDVAVLGFLGNALVGLGLGALWLRDRKEHSWV